MKQEAKITIVGTVHGGMTKERDDTLMATKVVPEFFKIFGKDLSNKGTLLILEGGKNLASNDFEIFATSSPRYEEAVFLAFGSVPAEMKCDITIADYRDAEFRKKWIALMRAIIDSKAVTFTNPFTLPELDKKSIDEAILETEDQDAGFMRLAKDVTINWSMLADNVFSSSRSNVQDARENIQQKILLGCDQAIIDTIEHFKHGYVRIISISGGMHAKPVSERTGFELVEFIPEKYEFTPETKERLTSEVFAALTLSCSNAFYDEVLKYCTLD